VAGRTDKTKNESALEEGQDFLDELLVQQIELQVQIQEQIQLPLFLQEEMIHGALQEMLDEQVKCKDLLEKKLKAQKSRGRGAGWAVTSEATDTVS
jgi:hypothetical protein